jgi:hypothetical protein
MKQETNIQNLARQVFFLKLYAVLLALALISIVFLYVLKADSGHFKEITAERINVVEQSGRLRMVISNRERQHPGVMDGKPLPKRSRPAGMIFFNDVGDECGGLVYDGDKQSASMAYSIDQWKNDQVMQLQYQQDNGTHITRSYGLKLWDRSDQFTLTRLMNYADSLKKLNDTNAYNSGIKRLKASGLLAKQRLFIGKNENGEVGLFLNDNKGAPRLKIFIDDKNQPLIEALDEAGRVKTARTL